MIAIALVQVTCPDIAAAEALAQDLIALRLIACANITPCRSIYRWEGAAETADEAILLAKTLPERAETAVARIAEVHPYTLPAIEHWPVETDDASYRWVAESLSGI